jgi:multiple sugar transport system substrate-binding protein
MSRRRIVKVSTKRVVAALILLLLATASALATGKQEPTTTAAIPGDWGKINWKQFAGTSINVLNLNMPVATVYSEFIKEFEDLTGIKVNVDLLNENDRRKKAFIDFSSHMGTYDVQSVGFANREEWAVPGYLEDLGPYLKNPKLTEAAWYDFSDYPKDVIASGYAKSGPLVFIPYTAEYFLLWYRKDIFKQLNLSIPTNFVELKETAIKLTEARKAGQIKEYAWTERQLPGPGEAGWSLFCTANRFNFDFIDFDKKISYVNTPKGREVLSYYTSMVMDYGPPGSANWGWPMMAEAFKQEKVAMITGGNASYTYLEDPSQSKVVGRVGYAPTPFAPCGKDPLWVWGWGINKDSKKKEAAWLFIEWATSKTLMNKMAPKYGCPARLSVYSSPDYVKAMPSQEFIDAQKFMMTKGINPHPQLINEHYAEGAEIVSKEMSNILAGIKDVNQAAADADKQLMALGYTPGQWTRECKQ